MDCGGTARDNCTACATDTATNCMTCAAEFELKEGACVAVPKAADCTGETACAAPCSGEPKKAAVAGSCSGTPADGGDCSVTDKTTCTSDSGCTWAEGTDAVG